MGHGGCREWRGRQTRGEGGVVWAMRGGRTQLHLSGRGRGGKEEKESRAEQREGRQGGMTRWGDGKRARARERAGAQR
eukprot:5600684-Pleurochrysis_carterae.AAC.2